MQGVTEVQLTSPEPESSIQEAVPPPSYPVLHVRTHVSVSVEVETDAEHPPYEPPAGSLSAEHIFSGNQNGNC